MRITESQIAYDFLRSVNSARERITELQGQLASGKRIQKLSDDPNAADSILRLQAAMDRNDQYQRNVTDAQGSLETVGSTLDNVVSLMQEVQTIVVQASDGNQAASMVALGNRVDQILNEGLAIANTQFNGKALFGGTQTVGQPYTLVDNPGPPATTTITYSGNSETLSFSIGDGVSQEVSISGTEAFGGTALFDMLARIRDSLQSGSVPSAADTALVKTIQDNLAGANSKVGSFLMSLNSVTTHLADQRTQLQALMSSERDTDVAEATLDLKRQQTMLDAALNTGAKILPKTLMDYL